MITTFDQPHHDGSEIYVSNPAPELGDTVSVFVRVPEESSVRSVHARVTPDGEQQFVEAKIDRVAGGASWWRADLAVHNPVTPYRFLLEGGREGYQWLNGTGVHRRDVTDQFDFRLVAFHPPPLWARDAIVYQVFPDRFDRAEHHELPSWAVPAQWDDPVDLSHERIGRQLYGGDLRGILRRLEHIQRVGANTIYLTPFFPGESNHRYDAQTFDHVDPLLGGDEALRELLQAAQARSMRVLGDFTTNHTGMSHEWFRRALSMPTSEERSFYIWDDDGGYATWLGVESLPKLNYSSQILRARLFDDADAATARWVAPGWLDGWRVDVANMTGRHRDHDVNQDVARWMRAAMLRANPDSLLVAEHAHDYGRDAMGDGWHGVMNYAGFTRPVWTWLRDRHRSPRFLGSPLRVPRLGGASVAATMRDFAAQVPWRTVTNSFNLLGSHDTTRVRTLVGPDPWMVVVAVGLLMTMPGIPMLTYGDEIGMTGDFGEDGRKPFPWDPQRWDGQIFDAYRDLARVRRESHALRHGGFRWLQAEEDVLVFLRESRTERVLVQCARAPHTGVRIPMSALRLGGEIEVLFGAQARVDGDGVYLPADGPAVNVWRLGEAL